MLDEEAGEGVLIQPLGTVRGSFRDEALGDDDGPELRKPLFRRVLTSIMIRSTCHTEPMRVVIRDP